MKLKSFLCWVLVVFLVCVAGALLIAAGSTPVRSTDFKRYLTADSTNSTFQQAAGVQTKATIAAAGSAGTPLYPIGAQGGPRQTRLKLIPFGTGSADTTFDYRVYVAYLDRRVGETGEPQDGLVTLSLYGWGTVTLGTKAGDGTIVGSSDKYGDTITWNVAGNATAYVGIGEALELTQGVISDKYSPADNTQGILFLPTTGDALFLVIDFDLTGATGANFLVSDEG